MKKIKIILPLMIIICMFVTGCDIIASKNDLDIEYEEKVETTISEENISAYNGIIVGAQSLNAFINTSSNRSSSKNSNDEYSPWGENEQPDYNNCTTGSTSNSSATQKTTENKPKYQQMIIEGYYMRYKIDHKTNSVDKAVSTIEKKIEKYNGYIESMEMHCSDEKDEDGEKSEKSEAKIYIRIPTENLYEFISSLDNGKIINGTLLERQKDSKEVTTDYINTITHIETLKLKRERLIKLLEKANDLDTILTLEDRISDVEYDITFYEDKMNTFEDLVEYTQVRIDIEDDVVKEKEKTTKPDPDLDKEQIKSEGNGVSTITLGIILISIAGALYLIYRYLNKKSK